MLVYLASTACALSQQLRLEWYFETPVTEDHVFRDIAVSKSDKILYITDSQTDLVYVYRNDGSREPIASFGDPSWQTIMLGPYGIDIANDNEIYIAVANSSDLNGDGLPDHSLWRCESYGRNLTRLCYLPDFPRGLNVVGNGSNVVVYVDGTSSNVMRCTPVNGDSFQVETLFQTCVVINQQDVLPNRTQSALYVSSWIEGTTTGCGMPVTKWDPSGVRDPDFSTSYFPYGNCPGIGLDASENYLYVYFIRLNQYAAMCKLDARTGSLITSVQTGPGGTWGGGGINLNKKGEIYFARTLSGPASGPFVSAWGKVVDQGGGAPGQAIADNYDIYAFDAKTGGTFQVTRMQDAAEYNPSWSNSGKQIAHDRLTPTSHDIYITDVKTGVSTPLVGAEGGNDAAWSPNGQMIAFDRIPQGDNSIYVVPASGGARTLIAADAVDAAWAPNSKLIVFQRPSDGSLRTVGIGGGAATMLTPNGMNPVWSSDGQWIAFSSGGEIWKVKLDAAGNPQGAPVQVTTAPGYKSQPSWSQNSKTLVFHSNLGGSDFDIWTIPATGGTPAKLAGLVGYGEYDPSYSNNGQYVAYAGYTIPPPLLKSTEEAAVSSFTATVPLEFTLGQNYPNPFNPTTVIEYALPRDEVVSLVVYNTIGEEVAALVRGIRSAGVHSVTFNAQHLPSGVYLYRLVAGTFNETKKLAVVK